MPAVKRKSRVRYAARWSVLWAYDQGFLKSGPCETKKEAMALARKERNRDKWRQTLKAYVLGGAKHDMRLIHDDDWEAA